MRTVEACDDKVMDKVPPTGLKRIELDNRFPSAADSFSASTASTGASPSTSIVSWRACHCSRCSCTSACSRPRRSVSPRSRRRASKAAALKRSSASIWLCSVAVLWPRMRAISRWSAVIGPATPSSSSATPSRSAASGVFSSCEV